MAKTRLEVILEQLSKLRSELRLADKYDNAEIIRQTCLTSINALLDERLELRGAHPPDCGCDDCIETVRQALAHRLGEATGDEDTATIMDWGHAG